MDRRAFIGAAFVAVTALGLVVTGTAFAPGPPPPGFLCDLNPAVSQLLDCPSPQPTATEAQQTQQQGASEQTSTESNETTTAPAATTPSAPQLQPSPPVLHSGTRPTYEPNLLLVRFRPGASPAKTAALLAQLGVTTNAKVPQIAVRSVLVNPSRRAAVLAALQRSPLVAHAGRDLRFHLMAMPNDTYYARQWGLTVGGFTSVWNRSSPRSVVVAVVDTGVDATSPDLAGRVLKGVDVADTTNSTSDRNGHGTSVAGVIAALANNGIGGAGVCGVCRILPVKVIGASGTADTTRVAAGIVKAADRGARVINVSVGAPQSIDALQRAVDYATSKGAVVIAAAGNSGITQKNYPAAYPNVISVAGSTQSDRLYGWSNHGLWVSVAAPGCNVAPLLDGRGYGEFCGTSSATPLVAGLVALVRSARPGATGAQVTNAIERAAKRVSANVKYGRIDAGAAVAMILRPAT
jgi:subtilisin family serine protease